MKTIMITGPSSNSGKTVLTLGIIRAIKNRKINVSAFKTGPDFIDTKYLELASGKRAGNLDMHLMGREGIFKSLEMNVGEFAIIEGAMGYFDGIYNTFENSSYDISKELNVPSILVYSPKGEMFSAIPKIKGMVEFPGSSIKGLILNKVSKTMYELLKEKIEEYIDIKVLGYLPYNDELNIESRSLGLIGAEEKLDHEELIDKASKAVEKTINIDEILQMAKSLNVKPYEYKKRRNIKVAIAYDKAFHFYFNENLKLLENICEVEYFSPLKDPKVPDCDLIYIGGGYPENYLEELFNNKRMIDSIYIEAEKGKHIISEAGGFMYLVSSIENYDMVDIFKGKSTMTNRLQRFGYVDIELKEDTIFGKKGSKIPGNEYHKSVIEIEDKPVFNIKKPKSSRTWQCGYKYKNTLVYYQHINFLGNINSFYYLLDNIEKRKEIV